MSGFRNRQREYEEDPFDMQMRSIYDEIDQIIQDGKDDYPVDSFEADTEFWREDVEAILEDVGIGSEVDIPLFPNEQLERIEKYYKKQSETEDENGMLYDVDPVPTYFAGSGSTKNELYRLGYAVGLTGTVGKYYKLLPLINFSRGYWLGKFEKAVKDDSDEEILDVSREIKIVDPRKAERELTSIVNRCFTGIVDYDESTLNSEEGYLR